MKIIELTETQFKNYSKLHSSRNYYQTVEYAHSNKGTIYYLGYINENDNTLMAAVLLLERSLGKIKFGYVPGSFLVDYNNDNLFYKSVIFDSLPDYKLPKLLNYPSNLAYLFFQSFKSISLSYEAVVNSLIFDSYYDFIVLN